MKRLALKTFSLLLPMAILGGALYGASALIASAPETARVIEKRLAPVVATLPLTPVQLDRVVEAFGTVIPAQEVTLSAEVSGRVVHMHPELQPGGIVKEGDVLLRLDEEQYVLAISRAEAALQEAVAALEVEQGRQRVAQREFELFGQTLPEADLGRQLMLREPQLNQAEARIASAQADVEQARLDLRRTVVRAPFDALVLAEDVDIGQQIRAGEQVARLVGTDQFWVRAAVRANQLAALTTLQGETPLEARVFSEVRGNDVPSAIGRLVRHLGQVDEEGRLAQVLVAVDDPLALTRPPEDRVPLPLTTYVRVELDAGVLNDVILVPRDGMRENEEVWVADKDNRLRMRSLSIVWRQRVEVAVRDTFEPGDRLIVSPLDDALPGMELRVRGDELPVDEQRLTVVHEVGDE